MIYCIQKMWKKKEQMKRMQRITITAMLCRKRKASFWYKTKSKEIVDQLLNEIKDRLSELKLNLAGNASVCTLNLGSNWMIF